MKTPDGGNHTVKERLLMCSVDLPARALVLNMKQFNGRYGCCYCEDKGVLRSTSAVKMCMCVVSIFSRSSVMSGFRLSVSLMTLAEHYEV